MFLTMGVSLYTSRVVLEVLGISDYGVYSVVGGVVVLFEFFTSSMRNATQRFLSIEIGKNNSENVRQIFSTSIIIHIGISLILLLLSETIGFWFVNTKMNFPQDSINSANFVFQFSVLSAIVRVVRVPYNALIIANEKMDVFAYTSIFEGFIKLAVVYMLKLMPYDKLSSYSVLLFLSSLLVFSIHKLYCNRNFVESRFHLNKNISSYKEMLYFSSWTLIGSLSAILRSQGMNVMLNILFGVIVNAAYGVMIQVQSSVLNFVVNFQTAVNPQIIKRYSEGNKQSMFQLMFQSSKFSYYLTLILVAPIVYNIDFILEFWLIKPPNHSSNFVRLSLIFILIDCISFSLIKGIEASGKVKWYQITIGSLICLNLPISYILLQYWDIPELFLFVLIGITFLSLGIRMFFLRAILDFPVKKYFNEVLFRLFIVSAIVFSSMYLVSGLRSDSFPSLIVVSFGIVSYVVIIVYLFGIRSEERGLVQELFSKIFYKFST